MSDPMSRVLERLDVVNSHAGASHAKCPAHDDTTPSLTVSEGSDGRVLLHCHAGCTVDAIVSSIKLEVADLFPHSPQMLASASLGEPQAVYPYTDADGKLLAEFLRYPGKQFRWRRPGPDGEWIWNIKGVDLPPYRLPEMLSGISHGQTIFVVEGEKDADTLMKLGIIATTNPGGAGKWRSSHDAFFKGARVVVMGDNDPVGHEHQHSVAAAIASVAAAVHVLELSGLPEHGDVSNWLEAGGTAEQLSELADAAPEYTFTSSAVPELEPASGLPPRRRIKRLSELARTPKPDWIVDGYIPPESVVVLFGPSGSGKSFLMVDIASCVATGCDWHGRRVQRGSVVVVAAEGAAYLPTRFETWCGHRGVSSETLDVHLMPHGLQLLDQEDVDSFLAELQRDEIAPRIVFLDTLSLCLTPDGDENSTRDMNKAISLVRRITERTHSAVVLIHHTGKNGTGERGSSALRADADVSISSKADGSQLTLKQEKVRDAAKLDPLYLELLPIAQSAVVTDVGSPESGTLRAGKKETRLTGTDSKVLKVLSDGVAHSFSELEAEIPRSSVSRSLNRLVELAIIRKDASTRRPQYTMSVEGRRDGTSSEPSSDFNPNPSATSGEVPQSTTTPFRGGTVGPPGGNAERETTFLPPRTTQAAKEAAKEPSEIGAAA